MNCQYLLQSIYWWTSQCNGGQQDSWKPSNPGTQQPSFSEYFLISKFVILKFWNCKIIDNSTITEQFWLTKHFTTARFYCTTHLKCNKQRSKAKYSQSKPPALDRIPQIGDASFEIILTMIYFSFALLEKIVNNIDDGYCLQYP